MHKVLWIDDNIEQEYDTTMKMYSKRYKFQFIPFTTRNEGMAYFKKHHSEISAIILDGLFMVDSVDTEQEKQKALNLCLDDIREVEIRENVSFPRVIYSGQTEILDDADFEENRGIKVFEKTDDPVELYEYVADLIKVSSQAHIRNLYSDFAVICDHPMFDGADLWMKFLPNLESINSNKVIDARKQVADLRRVLDRVSKAMADYGIIPSMITKGTASLTLVSMFLNGKVTELRRDGLRYQQKEPILPVVFTSAYRFILDSTGIANHEEWENDTQLKDQSVLEYETLIPNHHLVQATTFIAMDLVIALHNYIQSNPDRDANAANWSEVKPTTVVGVLGEILKWGGAYLQPDGSTNREDNVLIPKDTVNEHQLAKGIRIEVTSEKNSKGNWQLVDVVSFPPN